MPGRQDLPLKIKNHQVCHIPANGRTDSQADRQGSRRILDQGCENYSLQEEKFQEVINM